MATGTLLGDPITFEVFKNHLIGLADEMGLVIMRTAHSPLLSEAMDFSTAICDAEGRVVAQGNGMMIHVGTYPDAMAVVLKKYEGRIYPGDVYIFNETPEAAQHLNDLYVVKPYFIEDQLIGFGIATAHHGDIGGSVPGSVTMDAQEIFQEGLQIPVVKLYDQGLLNENVHDLVMLNVRLPEMYHGDMMGQLAALNAGEEGVTALVSRYGQDGFRELSDELIRYTERLTRAAIADIPDGTYEFEDVLDDDGLHVERGPVVLKVKIAVSCDSIVVDWDGSAPQVDTSINCHMTNTRSVSYGVLMSAFGRDIPSNEGFYRPIEVLAPVGSVVNSQRPAARGLRGIGVCYRMIDTLLGALHQAVPDRIPAGSDGGIGRLMLTGVDAVGGRWIEQLVGSGMSGWGGRVGLDGLDYISPLGANVALCPVERTEQNGKLVIEHLGYEADTGGPGRWRGCLALRTDARVVCDETTLRTREQRRQSLAYGLAGGQPGTASRAVVNPGRSDEVQLAQTATVTLHRGDTFTYLHSAGGGYGDPLLRDVQAVLDDVLDEKITVAYARREYGVVVNVPMGKVDVGATDALRSTLTTDRRTT
jgi:N-methylhydantoinase B